MKSLRRLIGQTARRIRDGAPPKSNFSAVIGGKLINQIQPLGGKPVSKAGLITASGNLEGQRVKLYSMFSESQVALRTNLHALPGGILLPRLVSYEENIIVEEWIHGKSGSDAWGPQKDRIFDAITHFLTERQESARPSLNSEQIVGFDYLFYLRDRVKPWLFVNEVRIFYERWHEALDIHLPHLTRMISHPDLSLANIVISADSGDVYIIDNELLHFGYGGILDFRNSALNGKSSPIESHDRSVRDFVNLTWKLRQLGSALISSGLHNPLEMIKCEKL